jgi:hypothetical protein
MKKQFSDYVEKNRCQLPSYPKTSKGDKCGYFRFRKNGNIYHIIISDGLDWDHVSISLDKKRCPKWEEMCWVKDLFFDDDEMVIQIHPKKIEHINNSEYCLHLWRYQKEDFPFPNKVMVGL